MSTLRQKALSRHLETSFEALGLPSEDHFHKEVMLKNHYESQQQYMFQALAEVFPRIVRIVPLDLQTVLEFQSIYRPPRIIKGQD